MDSHSPWNDHLPLNEMRSTEVLGYLEQREQLVPAMLFFHSYRPFAFVLTQIIQLFMPIVALLHYGFAAEHRHEPGGYHSARSSTDTGEAA
ncbi:MAG: hypothetical protein KDE19_21280 [Caldilineaceae bacterium]|nr:hypothetical protein [Caldilineaceae bacterium]